ncbi:MAG: hypothetical protein ABSH41_00875 [Syntrophobacteraceae bacterium]|jgi:hypothetical protein
MEKDDMLKKDQRSDSSDQPKRITFSRFNTKTQKLEPYGSMCWNGQEWEVEEENRYCSIAAMLDETKGFGGRILTKKDRGFYQPWWHTPTTGWRVDVDPIPRPYWSKE